MSVIWKRLKSEPVLVFSVVIVVLGALGPGWPVIVAGAATSLLRLFVSPAT